MESDISDLMEDMKMSMQMLCILAATIRKLRMQRMVEEKKEKESIPVPLESKENKYQVNKWEVSPSG